jgi:hypothetical protein
MAKSADLDPHVISEAIVLWLGNGVTNWPQPDVQRLVGRFGSLASADLLPVVSALADEFYASDAALSVPDLSEATRVAMDRFRALHPELSDMAIEALGWSYSFDCK